jgi:hypothetical protein
MGSASMTSVGTVARSPSTSSRIVDCLRQMRAKLLYHGLFAALATFALHGPLMLALVYSAAPYLWAPAHKGNDDDATYSSYAWMLCVLWLSAFPLLWSVAHLSTVCHDFAESNRQPLESSKQQPANVVGRLIRSHAVVHDKWLDWSISAWCVMAALFGLPSLPVLYILHELSQRMGRGIASQPPWPSSLVYAHLVQIWIAIAGAWVVVAAVLFRTRASASSQSHGRNRSTPAQSPAASQLSSNHAVNAVPAALRRWSFGPHIASALDWLQSHRVPLVVALLGLLAGAGEWWFLLRENTPHKFDVDYLVGDCLILGAQGLFVGFFCSGFLLLPISLSFFTDPRSLGKGPASYELSLDGKRFMGGWIFRVSACCAVLGAILPISEVLFLRVGSITALASCIPAGILAMYCGHKCGLVVEKWIQRMQEAVDRRQNQRRR